MEYNGKLEIEIDLIIENPKMEVEAAFLECIFIDEDGFKQSRLMKVDLSTVNINDAIQTNDITKKFK